MTGPAPRHKVPLTRQRQAQRQGVFKGSPLTVSAAATERYTAGLLRAVNQMAAASERELRAVFEAHAPHLLPGADSVAMDASIASQARILLAALQKRFAKVFASIAPTLAEAMTNDVNRHSKSNLRASLREMSGGLSLKTSVLTKGIATSTKAAVAANVDLIKSIPQEYFADISGAVYRSIQQGHGTADVLGAVEKTGTVTRARAKLIARDQTSKATSAINEARMKSLGVDEFEWLHSAGGHEPRPLHINSGPGGLNRHIFKFSDLPVIDERTGERGLPGQLINCRCRMVPVIRWGKASADQSD